LIKNAPHPNAATLFIDWLLSTDGQTAFTRALGQPTRCLDVDAQWTKEFGYVSAKEALTPEKYDEMENGSEEMVLRVRKPAMKLAEKLFQCLLEFRREPV
jgi:ABC-type Fe3+ transport system substrate-binding protein